jgi:DNA-binding beta-propeller fold protein YncE
MAALGGGWLYAANIVSGSVSRIDPAGVAETRAWPAGTRTEGVAATPDGAEGWTGSMDKGTVVGVNGETGEIVATVQGLQVPYRLAITADGSTVVVSDPEAQELVLIDRAKGTLSARIDIAAAASAAGFTNAPSPQGFTLSPDGLWAFVSAKEINQVAVVDLQSRTVQRFVESGTGPDGIAFSTVGGGH